jgi:hypothetical protein
MVPDATQVSTTGGGTIAGTPAVAQDAGIVDSTFTNFGDMDWDELSTLAQLEGKNITSYGTTITNTLPVSSGGVCDESVPTNWGDINPAGDCGSYFPLIYHGGPSLRISSGGMGQGILLVDGTLDLRGNFTFHGIIIVQGTFETQGAGNRITGAVMASNGELDMQGYVGGSEILYSSCAVQRSILNNASLSRARPLSNRSWIDLSTVLN